MLSRLYRNVSVLALLTLISRTLGFGRDMIWAMVFGASAHLDAFIVAFSLFHLLRRLFAEGAFSQALTPVLEEYNKTNDKSIAYWINALMGQFLVAGLAAFIFIIVLARFVIVVLAPGYYWLPETSRLAAQMLRIMAPFGILLSMTALLGALLHRYRHFQAPALAPIVLNLTLIAGALLLAPYVNPPIQALAWSVLVGGCLQFIIQLSALKRFKTHPKPTFVQGFSVLKTVVKRFLPAVFGAAMIPVSFMVDTCFASFLPQHHLTWLYYSERLVQLPLSLLGTGLAVVLLPEFTAKAYRHQAMQSQLRQSMKLVLIIALPASLGLMLLAGPILNTLFHHGAFTWHDVEMSRTSLAAYACGLPALMLVKVLISGYYACQSTRPPIYAAGANLISNIALNAILMQFWGFVGLAAASAMACWLSAIWLLAQLNLLPSIHGLLRHSGFAARLVLLNSGLAAGLLLLKPSLAQWAQWSTPYQLMCLTVMIFSSMCCYTVGLKLTGFKLEALTLRPER